MLRARLSEHVARSYPLALFAVEALDALVGRYVSLLCVDSRLTLILLESRMGKILRSRSPPLMYSSTLTDELNHPWDQSRLGPVFSVFMQTVESVSLAARGALSIVFESGARFAIEPHHQFEAWEVSGPSIGRWICVEGGEIQHFS